jgi:hypothetical protein
MKTDVLRPPQLTPLKCGEQMFADLSKFIAVSMGVWSVIGLTTFYSIDKDTALVIRRSMRALSRNQYLRYEHVIYFIVKTGQKRIQLLGFTLFSYFIHLIFIFVGI